MQNRDLNATVLRIERGSIYDGDGSRTVVYLKGCNMRCAWCSTPESHSFEIERTDKKIYGKIMTVEQVMQIIRKDSLFYFNSGGGVTLSGGEVLCQAEFARAVYKTCKGEGYHTAIETGLNADWENVKNVFEFVDQAYVDMKFFDSKLHKKYTGVGNDRILANLINLNEWEHNFNLRIRIPIIPGINDSYEELINMAKFCQKLKKLEYVELLAYHRLGTDTYEELGIPYKLKDIKVPDEEYMEEKRKILEKYIPTIYLS